MRPREGVRHLLDELLAGLPEREVVITELAYHRDRYRHPDGKAPTVPQPVVTPVAAEPSIAEYPLVDHIVEYVAGERLVTQLNLDPCADAFLHQHKFRDRPLMPVVVTLEAIAQTAALLAGTQRQVVGLRDIKILNGLRFFDDQRQTARVHAIRRGDLIECRFTCDFYNRRGQLVQRDKPYLQAVVELAAAAHPCPPQQLLIPDCEWHPIDYPESETQIWHGPIFRTAVESADDGQRMWARLIARPTNELHAGRSGSRWLTPSALLDGCFFVAGIFIWLRQPGAVSLPDGLESIRLGRPARPGEQCVAQVQFRTNSEHTAFFDIRLTGDDGRLIADIAGYHNRIARLELPHAH